jgi:hypothetical protein
MAIERGNAVNPDEIKEWVKSRYDKFAAQGGSKESC